MNTPTRARTARASTRAAGALSAGVAALAAPAAVADAQAPAPPPPPAGGTAAPAPATPTLRASARHHVRAGSSAPVRGTLSSGESGRRVRVQVRQGGGGWRTVARTRTHRAGRFDTRWRARRIGSFALRVQAPGTGASPRRVRGRVTVYRAVTASWYGPGLYGNHLACGGRLSAGTIGVANKTLPCGTEVTLRYRGRSVTVRVVDRGPYVGGRTYDLTAATKQRLGFGSTGTVWSSR